MSPIPAMSETASIDQDLNNMMMKLHTLIKKLPSTLPGGTKDGPIAKHFTECVYNTTEGPYFSFNHLWDCVFQLQNVQIEHLVIHGKHGLDLVYSYISHFSNLPGMDNNNRFQLVALWVESLIGIVEKLYVNWI